MKLDSKKILTIGAGAVVGYLLFCKFMKSGAEKSLDTGASTDEGGFGGGGGGGFGGGAIAPLPPVVASNLPPNYVIVPNTNVAISRDSALMSNVQSGNSPIASGDTSANIGRATPPPPPSTPPVTKPPITDVSGAPVVAISASKFTDFDGNPNFQDALL